MSGIREALPADRAAVIAVWEACELTRPWNDPVKDFDRALDFEGSTVLVSEQEGAVIGTAMVGFDGHRGWIYYLGVAPECRGRGVARQLVDACESWLWQRGCPKVELMLREGNPAAGFYRRLGWEEQPVQVYARWLTGEDAG